MNIYPFHSSEPDDGTQFSKGRHPREQTAILSDIARHAIVEDEPIRSLGVNIEFDSAGNVIIKEHELSLNGAKPIDQQKYIRRLPQEEAYLRIAEAVQNKVALLERLYEENRKEAQRWFVRSLCGAVSEALVITFSILAPIFFQALREPQRMTPFAVLLFLINTFNIGLTLWILRQSHAANARVDLYLHSLHEVRNFSTITHFLTRIQMNSREKQFLQKALICHSLGLAKPDFRHMTESHKDPQYRTEPH